jgi:hypothetical protein
VLSVYLATVTHAPTPTHSVYCWGLNLSFTPVMMACHTTRQDKSSTLKIKASESDELERKLIEITEAHATAKTFLLAKTRLLQARESELNDLRARVFSLETNSSAKDQAVKGMVRSHDTSMGFGDRAQSAEYHDFKTSPGKRRPSQMIALPSIVPSEKSGARRMSGGGGRRTTPDSTSLSSAAVRSPQKVGGRAGNAGKSGRVFVQDRRSGEFRRVGVE